jgi:hypothetical protein
VLALIISSVVGFVALFVATCGGELRYECPDRHPGIQRFAYAVSGLLLALALCAARYL